MKANRRRRHQRRHDGRHGPSSIGRRPTRSNYPLALEPEWLAERPSHDGLEHHELGLLEIPARCPSSAVTNGSSRGTWSTSASAGPGTAPTACNRPSSTAWATRAGRTSGASGTSSRRATREALRRTATIERAVADLLTSPDLGAPRDDAAAGRLRQPLSGPRPHGVAAGESFAAKTVPAISFACSIAKVARYYDLWHGAELKPEIAGKCGDVKFRDRRPRLRRRA